MLIIEPRLFADERGYFMETHHFQRFQSAGIACTFAIGVALMSTLSGGFSPGSSSLAQLEEGAQYSEAIGKSDLVIQGTLSSFTGSVADTSPIDAGYKKISVSFAKGDTGVDDNGGRLAGTLGPIYPDLEELPLAYNNETATPVTQDESQGSNTTTVAKTALPKPFEQTVKIGKGETLTGILVQLGAEEAAINAVVRSLNSAYPVRNLICFGTNPLVSQPGEQRTAEAIAENWSTMINMDGAVEHLQGNDHVMKMVQKAMSAS